MARYRGFSRATLFAALCPLISPALAGKMDPVTELHQIGRDRICVTNGVVSSLPDDWLAIDTPSSRGVVPGSDGTVAEIHFRYLGPAVQAKPLASGEMRRQIGIKLRAHDACNLLYAMWHITPDSKIEISLKKNPTQHTSAECHAGGYSILKPTRLVTVPPIHPGDAHTLRVALNGASLVVIADGREAWTGTIDGGLDGIAGPAGFRTDNGRFEVEFFAAIPGSGDSSDAKWDRKQCDHGGP